MDLLSNTLSFLLSSYGIISFHRDLEKLNSEQNQIKSAKIHTPTSFIESFSNITKDTQNEKLESCINNKNELIFKGFMEGIVHSNNFVSSSLEQTVKLIYQMSFLSKIYDNDRFVNLLTILKQIPRQKSIKQVSYFDLKDYENNTFCRIYRNLNVVAIQALNLIKTHKNLDKKISVFKRILSFFYIFFQIISLFAEDKISYKGVQVGTCEIELGIQLNDMIMVYGDIIYNLVTKSLRIERPEFFVKDKSFILDVIAKKIKRKRFVLIIYYIVNFYSGFKLLKKIFLFFKRRNKVMAENEQLKLKNLEKFKNCENMKCVICYQQVRNIIFTPCKHLAICHFCFQNIKRSKVCPICKDRFVSYVELFTK